jgi:elongator complex protein 3
LYCFAAKGFTRSTSPNEDTLLARNSGWDPILQLQQRLTTYGLARGLAYKYDLAVKGDSFTRHSWPYLTEFVRQCYDFFNDKRSCSLAEAAISQAHAPDRCVTFKVETRPDYIDEERCLFLRSLGVTTVELGVQSIDEAVLQFNKRGHDVEAVIRATRLLKAFGFEVLYQIMVGLPGSNRELDEEVLAHRLWTEPFCPDALKIYPCIFLRRDIAHHFGLGDLRKTGAWTPMTNEEYVRLLRSVYPSIPRYAHVNRIQRLIEPSKVAAGPAEEIDRKVFNNVSRCLWQRSVAQRCGDLNSDFSRFRIESYPQGSGYCFEAVVDEDTVIGYGRLSVPPDGTAIVRDARALGNMLPVGVKNEKRIGTQHIGVGTKLVGAMEASAKALGARQIRLWPSVGSRSYFERLGYSGLQGSYLQKRLEGISG